MNKKIFDNRISSSNKYEFNKRGWTLVDLRLSKETIHYAITGLNKMRQMALKIDYKPRRIYYDHLFTNNLAAIELPFNNQICNENIKELFKEAKIGSLIRSLMDWKNPCCDLARLFCMGNFNYRGNWHRDYQGDLETIHDDSNLRDVLLVGIYIMPQNGFRILKKDYEFNGKNSVVPDYKTDKSIRSFPFPLLPPKDSYDEINGKIGTALFFDPFLLHQGSNYRKRLDFHMKFVNSSNKDIKKNDFQDFSVIDILHENYELTLINSFLNDKNLKNVPLMKRSSLSQRVLTSIDYRTCLKRFLKIDVLRKNKYFKIIQKQGWDIDIFSNTLFQK